MIFFTIVSKYPLSIIQFTESTVHKSVMHVFVVKDAVKGRVGVRGYSLSLISSLFLRWDVCRLVFRAASIVCQNQLWDLKKNFRSCLPLTMSQD